MIRYYFLLFILLSGCASTSTTRSPRRVPEPQPKLSSDKKLSSSEEKATLKDSTPEVRLSMTFKEADLSSVLTLIAREYKVTLVAKGKIEGKVTLSLHQVSLEEALDAVLTELGYGYILKNQQIIILDSEQIVSRVFPLRFSEVHTLLEILQGLTETGVIKADALSNSLIITDKLANLKKYEEIIQLLDAPQKSVMIEAEIYEISLDKIRSLGLQWELLWSQNQHQLNALSPFTIDPENLVLGYSNAKAAQLQALIEALQTDNEARLLSCPRIMTLNGQKANILVGERVPYVRRSAETAAGGMLQEVEFVEVGIKLEVTPRILEKENLVLIEVHPEVSEVLDKLVQGVPRIGTREASTRVAVRDGEPIVIGGLMRKNQKKSGQGLPFLSEIFFLNWLFKNRKDENLQTELIVFITPHILKEESYEEMNKQKNRIQEEMKLDKGNQLYK